MHIKVNISEIYMEKKTKITLIKVSHSAAKGEYKNPKIKIVIKVGNKLSREESSYQISIEIQLLRLCVLYCSSMPNSI